MQYWIRFKKQGFQKYISHRDMLRVFTRAMRRAGLPVALSQGFNPHLLISFSPPIELGVASEAEYLSLNLHTEMAVAEIIRTLNRTLPIGLELVEGMAIPTKVTNLMAWIESSRYLVTVDHVPNLDQILKSIEEATAIVRQRRSKRAVRDVDIRPWIHDLAICNDNTFLVQLQTGQNGNLKISQFMSLFALFGGSSDVTWQATRLELYGRNNAELVTPLVLLQHLKERGETIGK